jgi:type II secretion system protein G
MKKIKKNGFTLMELLVVIAILGLLATIGLASFRSSQIKGRDVQRKSDLNQIQKALEMYYNDYGFYPDSLIAGGESWEDEKGTLYMKEVPADPKGDDYCYEGGETEPNGGGAYKPGLFFGLFRTALAAQLPVSGSYRWYRLYAKLENSQDPGIEKSGCEDVCSCDGDDTYNYKVESQNIPMDE